MRLAGGVLQYTRIKSAPARLSANVEYSIFTNAVYIIVTPIR